MYDACAFLLGNAQTFCCLFQVQFVPDTMPKKGNNKANIVDDESNVKMTPTPRVEIIYEYTKFVIEVEPEFKWGHISHMLHDKTILDVGLEDMNLFNNILRSGITKFSTRPELFPCPEVMG